MLKLKIFKDTLIHKKIMYKFVMYKNDVFEKEQSL